MAWHIRNRYFIAILLILAQFDCGNAQNYGSPFGPGAKALATRKEMEKNLNLYLTHLINQEWEKAGNFIGTCLVWNDQKHPGRSLEPEEKIQIIQQVKFKTFDELGFSFSSRVFSLPLSERGFHLFGMVEEIGKEGAGKTRVHLYAYQDQGRWYFSPVYLYKVRPQIPEAVFPNLGHEFGPNKEKPEIPNHAMHSDLLQRAPSM